MTPEQSLILMLHKGTKNEGFFSRQGELSPLSSQEFNPDLALSLPPFPQTLWIPAGLTQSHGVAAEAGSSHNDLIQGFLVSQHLEDLPGKAEQSGTSPSQAPVWGSPQREGTAKFPPGSRAGSPTHGISVGRAAVQGSVQDTEFPDGCHLIHGL